LAAIKSSKALIRFGFGQYFQNSALRLMRCCSAGCQLRAVQLESRRASNQRKSSASMSTQNLASNLWFGAIVFVILAIL